MIDAIDEMIEEKRKEKSKNSEMVEISNALGVDILKIQKTNCVKNLSKKKIYEAYSINDFNGQGDEKLAINIKNTEIFTKYNLIFTQCSFENFSIGIKTDVNFISFNECSFENIDLDYVTCEGLNFLKCDIKSLFLHESEILGDFILKSKDDFDKRECVNVELGKIEIIKTKFKGKCDFSNNNFKKLDLSHSIFESDVDFSGCSFGTKVDVAKTIDLSSIIFEKDAKFDKSYFNNFVAFHMSSFNGTASFYGCHFNTIPNFSPADFKGILNINNAKWGENDENFDFEKVKELVENAYKNKSKSNEPMENVKNIRNSFSGIKHKLIEQDNLLEAQDFHKAELYCKEIELGRKAKKGFVWSTMLCLFSGILLASLAVFFYIDFSFDAILSKVLLIDLIICSFYVVCFAIVCYKSRILKFTNFDKQVDRVLLLLYRYTSEHHTNFSKIFHMTLIVIASYGGTLFVLGCIATETVASFLISMLIFLGTIFVLCWLYNDICELFVKVVLYFAMILILFNQPSILNPVLGISQSDEYKNAKLNEVLDDNKSLLNAASIIMRDNLGAQSSREIIIENKNIIKDSTELNASFDSIKQAIKQDEVIYATRQSMSVIYLVLLILCIFSLQKTARKNTIVPS